MEVQGKPLTCVSGLRWAEAAETAESLRRVHPGKWSPPHPAEMTGKIKKEKLRPCCERGRYGRDSTEQLSILKATETAECIILPKICRILHRLLWKYSVKINNPVPFYFPEERSRNSAAVS